MNLLSVAFPFVHINDLQRIICFRDMYYERGVPVVMPDVIDVPVAEAPVIETPVPTPAPVPECVVAPVEPYTEEWARSHNLNVNQTLLVHLKALRDCGGDFRQWIDSSSSLGIKESRTSYFVKWAALQIITTSEDVFQYGQSVRREMVNCKLVKGTRMGKKDTEKYNEDLFPKIADRINRPVGEIGIWDIFGCALPPRRAADLAYLVVRETYDSERDAKLNVYERSGNRLVFNVYKTSKIYGQQIFDLGVDSDMSKLVGAEMLNRVVELLRGVAVDDYVYRSPAGEVFKPNFLSTRYIRVLGFCVNDARHYWSSIARKFTLPKQRFIAEFMSHSIGQALMGYAVDEATGTLEE